MIGLIVEYFLQLSGPNYFKLAGKA